MKSQIVLPKNLNQSTKTFQELLTFKKPLKAKNFIFSRKWSLKLQRDTKIKRQFHNDLEEEIEQQNFVPKLKSKQLLREPKFFFSVERKKQKNEQSEPLFDKIKIQNPEMKGSKTKDYYNKIFFSRKQSVRQVKQFEQFPISPNKSTIRKLTAYPSQSLKANDILQHQPMIRKFSCTSPSQKNPETREMRRPNIHENISFLIRRKREIKSKTQLNRINSSKHQMTEFILSTEVDKI